MRSEDQRARAALTAHAGSVVPLIAIYSLALLLLAASAGGVERLGWLGISRGAIPLLWAGVTFVLVAQLAALRGLGSMLAGVRDRAPVWAALAVAASAFVSAGLADDRARAFGHAFELTACLCALALAASLASAASDHGRRLARALATVALASVAINALLCLTGPGVFGLLAPRPWPYQVEAHQHLSTWPRFYGLGLTPLGLGITMYANVGLLEAWPSPRVRAWARAAAVAMTAASLSFATLLLPVLAFARIRRAWPRRLALLLTLAAALGALYAHPLELRWGAHRLTLGTLHPNYGSRGRGPTYMPVREVSLGPATLVLHGTAYYYLMRSALDCPARHPVFGVGGGNAQRACTTYIMNTYGTWSHEGRLHNEYLGALAELGLAGVLAALALAYALGRRHLVARARPWPRAALIALAGCAFGGRAIMTLPFMLLVAMTSGGEPEPPSTPSPPPLAGRPPGGRVD